MPEWARSTKNLVPRPESAGDSIRAMADAVPRPTGAMLASLSPKERALFQTARLVTEVPGAKRALYQYGRTVGTAWIWPLVRRLVRVHGLERLERIAPTDAVLLVANHRSYFDFYVVLAVLLRETRLGHRGLYFPVRGNYYYDHLSGLALNLFVGGLSMFPPIFREGEKRDFNRYTMDYLLELCRTPGVLVGFHPEGTRNKTDDPYTLLPAQPGVGKLVLEAQPRVVPLFINGLSNNFPKQIVDGLRGRGELIHVVFGDPVDPREFAGLKSRLTTQKKVADKLRLILTDLGQEEKRLRA